MTTYTYDINTLDELGVEVNRLIEEGYETWDIAEIIDDGFTMGVIDPALKDFM